MSIAFDQSLQSIQRDHGRLSLTGAMFAVSLLLVWIAWFFLAPIAIYEHGVILKSTRNGSIIAQFTPEVAQQLHLGQAASLNFYPAQDSASQDEAAQANKETIKALITDISQATNSDQFQVTLYPEEDVDLDTRLAAGESGEVEVVAEKISPAILVFRVSGQFLETAPVSLSH